MTGLGNRNVSRKLLGCQIRGALIYGLTMVDISSTNHADLQRAATDKDPGQEMGQNCQRLDLLNPFE